MSYLGTLVPLLPTLDNLLNSLPYTSSCCIAKQKNYFALTLTVTANGATTARMIDFGN